MVYAEVGLVVAVVAIGYLIYKVREPERLKRESCPACGRICLGWHRACADGSPDLRFKDNWFGCYGEGCDWRGSPLAHERVAEHDARAKRNEHADLPAPNALVGLTAAQIAQRFGKSTYRSLGGDEMRWDVGSFCIKCTMVEERCVASSTIKRPQS